MTLGRHRSVPPRALSIHSRHSVRIDRCLLTSSLWSNPDATRLFLTALLHNQVTEYKTPVMALDVPGLLLPPGRYGFCALSQTALAQQAGLSREVARRAMLFLTDVDPESRDPDLGGRRLVRVRNGWVIVNGFKYQVKNHQAALRQRAYRERLRAKGRAELAGVLPAVLPGEPEPSAAVEPPGGVEVPAAEVHQVSAPASAVVELPPESLLLTELPVLESELDPAGQERRRAQAEARALAAQAKIAASKPTAGITPMDICWTYGVKLKGRQAERLPSIQAAVDLHGAQKVHDTLRDLPQAIWLNELLDVLGPVQPPVARTVRRADGRLVYEATGEEVPIDREDQAQAEATRRGQYAQWMLTRQQVMHAGDQAYQAWARRGYPSSLAQPTVALAKPASSYYQDLLSRAVADEPIPHTHQEQVA